MLNANLLKGIEKLPMPDLEELNKRVVMLIRAKRDVASSKIMLKLRVGMKCQVLFRGMWTDSKIAEIRQKRIIVELNGTKYSIKPLPEHFRLKGKRGAKVPTESKELTPGQKAWRTRRRNQAREN